MLAPWDSVDAIVTELSCVTPMALLFPLTAKWDPKPLPPTNPNSKFSPSKLGVKFPHNQSLSSSTAAGWKLRRRLLVFSNSSEDSVQSSSEEAEVDNLGVKAALSMLRFYKREISPLLPNSCRYIPTCSEYSMIAYKKYGVVKGTILTAWRLCRCNPLGGSGFDPPRWFDEATPPEQ